MTTTYTPAPPDITDRIAEVLMDYHGDLAEHGVTIGILMATSDDEGEPTVKLHGYPCAATIQITSYKNRCLGIADAVITIDSASWREFTEAEKIAALDHELMHLELVFDKDGVLKTDDANRPKLKMRLHDFQIGGFAVIAERHGAASIESQEFRSTYHHYYQQLFKWSDDQAGEPEHETEPEKTSVIVINGTFDALRSVGHTVDQAREAIRAVLKTGKRFENVADLIDAIYQQNLIDHKSDTQDDTPPSTVSITGAQIGKLTAVKKQAK
jgi:hypothetical protein